jgi:hypothetical protein
MKRHNWFRNLFLDAMQQYNIRRYKVRRYLLLILVIIL